MIRLLFKIIFYIFVPNCNIMADIKGVMKNNDIVCLLQICSLRVSNLKYIDAIQKYKPVIVNELI